MAVLCIAGSGSGAGKTAVGCELIRALPEWRWLAIKISPHVHAVPDDVSEETDPGSPKDTGRYLAAGAKRALLVAGIDDVLDLARRVLIEANDCDVVLVESGMFRASELAQADEASLTMMVLAGSALEWKTGSIERARNAGALVLANGMNQSELPDELRQIRAFALPEGAWQSAAMVDFVRERLGQKNNRA